MVTLADFHQMRFDRAEYMRRISLLATDVESMSNGLNIVEILSSCGTCRINNCNDPIWSANKLCNYHAAVHRGSVLELH
jgi:hypothetical protein